MKPEQLKHNIAQGTLTSKRHFWETAKREGFEQFVREVSRVFGIDAGEIVKDGETIARWERHV